MSTQQESYQKLATVLKPLLDEMKKGICDQDILLSQEILIAIGKLDARLDALEKLTEAKKRPAAARTEKKAGEEGTPSNEAAPPTPQPKNFAVNKLVYFREKFKTDAAYRNKYVDNDLNAKMAADNTISSKTKEDQKLVAQATFCWNYFKTHAPDTLTAIEKDYIQAKADHEATNRPAQQNVEARTPPAGQ